jgi:peroxiredoxin Q/BCP
MEPSYPQVGQPAPSFTALTDSGSELSLASLSGRWVVLYFYPKDDTPGCTVEACGFRDALRGFERLHAEIIGVSPDSVTKHKRFKDKFKLPFTLLADTDHAIAEAYGTWQRKSMFGKKYWGVARVTFVIDPSGKIAAVFPKVSASGHADEVRDKLVELGAA